MQTGFRGESIWWPMGPTPTPHRLGPIQGRGCAGRVKLDRLSRSLKDILHIMEQISDAGAGFRSSIERWVPRPQQAAWLCNCLGVSLSSSGAWSVNGPRRPGGRSRSGARLRRPAKFALHQQQEVIKAVRDGSKQRRTLRAFSGCIVQISRGCWAAPI